LINVLFYIHWSLESGDIDYERITKICDREKKLIQHPSELNDNELYYPPHLLGKQFYMNISDASLSKRASDQWEHKRRVEGIQTYADNFEYTVRGIRIQRDFLMATMKDFRKPRINYLKDSVSKKEKDLNTSLAKPVYYPIELLCYAPLNQTDFELIYKLPSILVRISQLYRIERLRKLFADNIKYYSVRLLCQRSSGKYGRRKGSRCLRNEDDSAEFLFKDKVPRTKNKFRLGKEIFLSHNTLSTII
jgi:hypothetical protein